MKRTNNFLMVTVVAVLFACGGAGQQHNHDHDHDHGATQDSVSTEAHGHGMEYTSTYVCPMHCQGSGGDVAGTCPVCGMDYVKLDEHLKDGHSH